MPNAVDQYFDVQLSIKGWKKDTLEVKMPAWMPGYYQLINYAGSVEDLTVTSLINKKLNVTRINNNTWQVKVARNKDIILSYKVKASKQFVANPFIDSTHAYIAPCGVFMYIPGYISNSVSVKIDVPVKWKNIITGLDNIAGKKNEFIASDFDILFDCPILIGNLKELPTFYVKGKQHRFAGYNMGNFDSSTFMSNLQKVVTSASNVIGDIPYKHYTFLGIGPGRGGIEHLNNTTVSFDGKELNTPEGTNRTMSFLAHEYFHHYNVKRIRPVELGPFDYDRANRTTQLWISEGLSVYYEYIVVKRAGIIDEQTLFGNLQSNINAYENDPGKTYQSLIQASYETWSDGPFGKNGEKVDNAISYYDKGPIIGLLLDFEIRNATQNTKSLDNVMRILYNKYYKTLQRGFTDAEFQEVCEETAGKSLASFFEYIYTTKEIDYNKYLNYAGLYVTFQTDQSGKKNAILNKSGIETPLQSTILKDWLKN